MGVGVGEEWLPSYGMTLRELTQVEMQAQDPKEQPPQGGWKPPTQPRGFRSSLQLPGHGATGLGSGLGQEGAFKVLWGLHCL